MSNDIKVEIPSLPLNKTHKRLYPASSDPTFEHATYQDMVKYLTNKTSYFGQIIYCKDTDKLYKISKGESGQKVLKETTITTSENINYSNSELSGVTNVKTALDNVLTKSKENKESISDIGTKVQSIKTDLDNVINSNNGNNTVIENLNSQVESITTNVSNVKTSLDDVIDKSSKNKTAIGTLDGKVKTIETSLGTVTTNVNGAIDTSNKNKEAIGTIKSDIGAINGQVESINTNVDNISSSLDTAKSDISETQSELSTVKSDTNNIKTEISDIVTLLLTKFPTTYTSPTVSVTSKGGLKFEQGSSITPTITTTFTKHDAGNIVKCKISKDGVVKKEVDRAPSTVEFTDTTFELNSSVEYKAEFEHEAGAVKLNSLNKPSPDGRIEAGTKSATITLTPVRASWGFASNSPDEPTIQTIRAEETKHLDLKKGSTIRVVAQSTSRIVIFAYPAKLGECAKIRYEESGDDNNKTAFTPTTLQIPDKSNRDAIDYKVYYYIPKVQFGATATFTLTI